MICILFSVPAGSLTLVPTCRTDGSSPSKRMEIKNLIASLKQTNPFIEGNIFKSVENVNLRTIIAYKEDGVKHHFLEHYDEWK